MQLINKKLYSEAKETFLSMPENSFYRDKAFADLFGALLKDNQLFLAKDLLLCISRQHDFVYYRLLGFSENCRKLIKAFIVDKDKVQAREMIDKYCGKTIYFLDFEKLCAEFLEDNDISSAEFLTTLMKKDCFRDKVFYMIFEKLIENGKLSKAKRVSQKISRFSDERKAADKALKKAEKSRW